LLLDELGPRFKDWTGCEPLPVDADQLPAVIPGYKTPFRLLPYGVKACLSNKETTVMRRIARRTAPHFALGRNRELQGLARAIVKLWETSAIAKIAIKRGVPFASNDRMAEVLKKLTGGTLLSRNKEYIVFYRGNDFLPPVVTKTLTERQKLTVIQQDEEEKARQSAASSITISNSKSSQMPLLAGTLAETRAATANWGHQPCKQEVEKMMRESTLGRFSSLIRNHENKLALAKARFRKAERDLVKIQGGFNAADLPTDLETLTNEERILFRKMGLSMKPYLLLGRRDVYAGTIENMHLHWKYRELVKILVKGKNLAQVKHIAISLEAESGGVLVSVDKDTKGHIIIIYRGKNYFRPQVIRPKSLLTRRQALARSMELQRLEALKHHISDLQEMIDLLKSELDDKKNEKVIDGDKTMYSTLDNNDVSSDDDMEDLNTLSP
ncbi:chloroplastic group IIA intron splicing facilitator CRS1 chloroplastic-like, partial [Trifolium pratense]